MRRTLIAASATLALLSGAAFAQTTAPSTAPSVVPPTGSTMTPGTSAPTGHSVSADALLGKNVYGNDNAKIGEVDDVILDANGQAKQLVIGSGGFLGIGEKKIAVLYSAASWDQANNRVTLSGLRREDVKALPEFTYDDTMQSLNRKVKPADGSIIPK